MQCIELTREKRRRKEKERAIYSVVLEANESPDSQQLERSFWTLIKQKRSEPWNVLRLNSGHRYSLARTAEPVVHTRAFKQPAKIHL